MENCDCNDSVDGDLAKRHVLVQSNADLVTTRGVDWMAQDGVHTRLMLQTIMQSDSKDDGSHWVFAFYLHENQNGEPVRRILGYHGFTGEYLTLGEQTRAAMVLTPQYPDLMHPFRCDSISVTLGSPESIRSGSDASDAQELCCSCDVEVTDANRSSQVQTAKNDLWLPNDSGTERSWYVQRRTVSGTRHSRWCINLPYVYCQSRICQSGGSCGPWKYEHDGVCIK